MLRAIKELTRDGQLLLDIFVNFDCDLESSNLFERLINSLVRQAQQPVQVRAGQVAWSCVGAGPLHKDDDCQ